MKIISPGFLPNENGTNLDNPHSRKVESHTVSGPIIKDCSECPEMVVIPAGSFDMGSNDYAAEKPIHHVTIASFLMGKTEVTQGQWKAVMGTASGSFACGDNCPVEGVSWNDAKAFLVRLIKVTGRKYRLPTEAEWEFAARAGSTNKWSFGDDESQLVSYSWYYENSGRKTQAAGQTHPVSLKLPNAFGLYDMHGNVWEWTQDCWHDNYSGAPIDGSAWTSGCSGDLRTLRGGSWYNFSNSLRSANRSSAAQDDRRGFIGFRLARDFSTP